MSQLILKFDELHLFSYTSDLNIELDEVIEIHILSGEHTIKAHGVIQYQLGNLLTYGLRFIHLEKPEKKKLTKALKEIRKYSQEVSPPRPWTWDFLSWIFYTSHTGTGLKPLVPEEVQKIISRVKTRNIQRNLEARRYRAERYGVDL